MQGCQILQASPTVQLRRCQHKSNGCGPDRRSPSSLRSPINYKNLVQKHKEILGHQPGPQALYVCHIVRPIGEMRSKPGPLAAFHTYTHTHIHTYTPTHLHAYTHTPTHTHTHTHIHIHIHVHVFIYSFTCAMRRAGCLAPSSTIYTCVISSCIATSGVCGGSRPAGVLSMTQVVPEYQGETAMTKKRKKSRLTGSDLQQNVQCTRQLV